MTVTPDEKYVITAWLSSGDIRIHDVNTRKEIFVFKGAHQCKENFLNERFHKKNIGRIVTIAASGDSRYLVSGDATGQLKVWDLVNFKQVYDKEKFHSGRDFREIFL